MAQLTDDCFAFGGPMMSVDEAVAMIAARIAPVAETQVVPLAEADGRVLAEALIARSPLPRFANSAVDGYAVRSADLPSGAEETFAVIDRVAAGASAQAPLTQRAAVRIFTGAPMPQGADTVFMQEDVRVLPDGQVVLPSGLDVGANVRLPGEDIAVGTAALSPGRRLRPQDIALAAALGATELKVRRRPRVAVFSTGDELALPGAAPGPAQLFDSNRVMLLAMLKRLGCEVSDLGILRDEPASLAPALREAARGHDLVLTSGGVSTGEEDHVKAAVEGIGSLVLWRMAIKPGRPVAMGVIEGAPFIGLPGNPAASFVTFVYVVRPAILALSGAAQDTPVPMMVRATFSYAKKIGRREYVRASLARGADGAFEATKFPREGAGLLSSLVETSGMVELPEQVISVTPGQLVAFYPYTSLLA
jgi:molybdopterin molybdotransferase